MENETTTLPTVTETQKVVTADDPRIAQLTAALKSASETVTMQAVALAKLTDENNGLRAKPTKQSVREAAFIAPTGDCVYLGGVRHDVVKTLRADAQDLEVRRGHVDEGCTLVVIAKRA